jgi:hypothetical protein
MGRLGNQGWATKARCPIQAVLWLEWDTTALDEPFLFLGGSRGPAALSATSQSLMEAPLSPLSSRPERSVVEGSAVALF